MKRTGFLFQSSALDSCDPLSQLFVHRHPQHVGRHALRRTQRYARLLYHHTVYYIITLSHHGIIAHTRAISSLYLLLIPGIDLYDGDGAKVTEGGGRSMKITANPSDINVLPGCDCVSRRQVALFCIDAVMMTDIRMTPGRLISCSTVSIARVTISTCGWLHSQGVCRALSTIITEFRTLKLFAAVGITSFTSTSASPQPSA